MALTKIVHTCLHCDNVATALLGNYADACLCTVDAFILFLYYVELQQMSSWKKNKNETI